MHQRTETSGNRLLVMACSATKNGGSYTMQAVTRYTGPVWQTLKAVDPKGELAHVTALSALHGWVDGAFLMDYYDLRMDATSADAVRLKQTSRDELHPDVRTALMRATCGYSGPITEVCIVGGHLYQSTAEELLDHARRTAPEFFAADCTVTRICDQVGYMRKRLRSWLQSGVDAGKVAA